MPRFLIHAGFHKTGTSSLQRTMEQNAEALADRVRVITKDETSTLRRAAQLYAQAGDAEALELLKESVAALLVEVDPDETRDVVLSEEDLCGLIPWRHGKTGYEEAPTILKQMCDGVATRLPEHEVLVLLTLRQTAPWVKSCYSQHLRSTDIQLSLEEYLQTAAAHCDLSAEAERIRAAIAPIPVEVAWLEDLKSTPLGPATAALARLPQALGLLDQLTPCPPANTTLPEALAAEFLRLNRSGLDNWDLKSAKKQVRQKYWRAQRDPS